MYDELVKKIRHCATDPMHCLSCGEVKDGRCFKRLMTQAADAIEELDNWWAQADKLIKMLEMPRWIPVSEKLPKEMEMVLVTDGKNVGWSFCVNDYGRMEFYSPWKITHWMPLPQPPEEEEA